MYKLGYNEATMKKHSTLERDVYLCHQFGFDSIELRLDMIRDYLSRHTMDKLRELIAGCDLRLSYVNALYLPENIHESVTRSCFMEHARKCLDLTREIGVLGLVLVTPMLAERDPHVYFEFCCDWPKIHDEMLVVMNELSNMAASYGLKIAFEPVGFRYCAVRTVRKALQIVERIDSNTLGLTLDLFNIFVDGGCVDYAFIQTLPVEKIFQVHISDSAKPFEVNISQSDRTLCGMGVLPIHSFLKQLRQIGFEGDVSVELFNEFFWNQKPELIVELAYLTSRTIDLTMDLGE